MTISHSTDSRTALAAALVSHIGNGGTLNIYDASSNLLVSIPLSTAAMVASGVWASINGTPSAQATATGDVSSFKLFRAGGSLAYTGTVTASGGGGDLTIAGGAEIVSGETVTVTSHRWNIS